jgi:hypothetical protein
MVLGTKSTLNGYSQCDVSSSDSNMSFGNHDTVSFQNRRMEFLKSLSLDTSLYIDSFVLCHEKNLEIGYYSLDIFVSSTSFLVFCF